MRPVWYCDTYSLNSLSQPSEFRLYLQQIQVSFALNYKTLEWQTLWSDKHLPWNVPHSTVSSRVICSLLFLGGLLLFWIFANEFFFRQYLFELHHFLLHFRPFLFNLMGNRKVFFHFSWQFMPKLYHFSCTQRRKK